MELVISGVAVGISILSFIYTIYKNKDLTQVYFNQPVYIISEKDDGPVAKGAPDNSYTKVKTAIHVINASNHNRGYFDYNVQIIGDGYKLVFKDEKISVGNLSERSYNALELKGKNAYYVAPDEKIEVKISVKFIKNTVICKRKYQVFEKKIEKINWGDAPDELLDHTGDLTNS